MRSLVAAPGTKEVSKRRSRRWAAIIAINFIGPMLYLTRSRRSPAPGGR
jgi:hypothetical protein